MILFLDFDGVLHPENPNRPEDFSCRPYLWQILRACPTVEVVFSTQWRDIHTVDDLVEFATQGGGEDLAHRFVGGTPLIGGATSQGAVMHHAVPFYRREMECRLWLSDNGQQGRPWLALDDFDAYFTPACPMLYLVDHRTGLTEADVTVLIERLT
ncbi:HAD domain-containing protein [Sulfuricella sp.]|uniref:HAD domain-containing protein n=1 Tax=Sulfuricella sp. TaxID=2099377 RepID=UPI002C813AE0|nr:HAD domain-containing protein [Sulfuricella sp.]HUX62225.1 HAD domain-containing protein [Sulfuricella sp.]